MSTQRADEPKGRQLPTREEVLARAKPLPPYEEMIIEGLTDEEEEASSAPSLKHERGRP